MSLSSHSTRSAGSTHPSSAASPTRLGHVSVGMADPEELERRLRAFRDRTPLLVESTDELRVEAQRDYDQLIALGGRPTRPVRQHPDEEDTTGLYREEYEKIEVKFEVDKHISSSHWAKERSKWREDLYWWRKFKEDQQIHNKNGRWELELELENTDVGLVEALSKLIDWQVWDFMHQEKVHDAESFHEDCQQGFANTQSSMDAATNADEMNKFRKWNKGWELYMSDAQKQIEASSKDSLWVKSQWTEVIAEACSMIATAPNLQNKLEAKLETQTKAIYRTLEQEGARPSHTIYPPDVNVKFAQRAQHWIAESSAFIAELWDWRVFMEWRTHVGASGDTDQEGRKVVSEVDSYPELLGDLVKYHQHELDKANSWANSWRHQLKHYMEAKERSKLPFGDTIGPSFEDEDEVSYENDEDREIREAENHVKQSEEQVSVAAQRLEQSIQKLQHTLADFGPPSTRQVQAESPKQRLPPTPPNSQSAEILPKKARPSKKREPTGKGHRRAKKEKARKGGAKIGIPDTEQRPLPTSPSGPNDVRQDDDIEMPNEAEGMIPVELKEDPKEEHDDTVMPDTKDPPLQTPQSPPESQHTPTTKSKNKKRPPPTTPPPTSRKTRSATKLDQRPHPSGKILKKPGNNQSPKKPKVYTDQQTAMLLNAAAAAAGCPSTVPTMPRRSERLRENGAPSKNRVCR